jgi:hypothetical protein
MKLRFRKNNLRLRVNRQEVELLAAGQELRERVAFAGGATLDYILIPAVGVEGGAEFDGKAIRVTAALGEWARGAEIGFYFDVEPGLKVAVEKDLECVHGPEDEKDPHAFAREWKG